MSPLSCSQKKVKRKEKKLKAFQKHKTIRDFGATQGGNTANTTCPFDIMACKWKHKRRPKGPSIFFFFFTFMSIQTLRCGEEVNLWRTDFMNMKLTIRIKSNIIYDLLPLYRAVELKTCGRWDFYTRTYLWLRIDLILMMKVQWA